ncbi:NADPH-dependent 7-cyano-7-deazaguanine reductase QueF [Pantoea sp. Aalb]|uniref:NADPH-dependent 7-cyano-7-deazaguanine reductase QueF n=1 Tax=Pantoea sp. Aalb TaxID=2576762 RepID=UPI00132BF5C9|nr:NADPH-dependent 7-cyano-7-deazaguanine reductase QueF [Pantoea sp. Aalb]MXP67751.1 NADPH-dependent 7-cyano-7-deazaguanine reductase QueF [Pantoea sp. Aalb]
MDDKNWTHKLSNLSILHESKTIYKTYYNKMLLQSIPRCLNRDIIGISLDCLPFHGADIWTLYEVSWLNIKGIPQVAIGQIIFATDTKNIIESKSLKLYLNSFNQTVFVNWNAIKQKLENDLTNFVCGNVKVQLFHLDEPQLKSIGYLSGYLIDNQDISINTYNLNSNYLFQSTNNNKHVEETLISHLLKSNCLITNQPDWGSIMIRYKGPHINHESLLRYLISFRKHNDFHEHCVERIFTDIQCFCHPKELTVYARYTRRGGIDINPWRSNVSFSPNYSRLIRQ